MPSRRLCLSFLCCVAAGSYLAVDNAFCWLFVALVSVFLHGRWGAFVGVAFVVSCTLSSSAWQSLDEELPHDISGIGMITSDPEQTRFALRTEIEVDQRKYQAWFDRNTSPQIVDMQVGDRVQVAGQVSELSGKATPSLRRKHIAGRLQVESIELLDRATGIYGIANNVRSLVAVGSSPMDPEDRALYSGLVMGDDRSQSETQREQFRNAGITHLLAVSGQNVAFLLLVLSPVILLLGRRSRIVFVACALVVFGTVTRWEPSVVRAIVMTSVALLTHFAGRKIDVWRTLCLGIGAALLIDPFLVGSIGFLLSATACVGIAVFTRPLQNRLRGPLWFKTPLAVTAGAQIGVAPVQLLVFGPMPVVALGTNLLAGPLAGFVMMWGMTAGVVAGLAGGPWAVILMWPPNRAIDLLAWVAQTGSQHSGVVWSAALFIIVIGLLIMVPFRQRRDLEQTVVY